MILYHASDVEVRELIADPKINKLERLFGGRSADIVDKIPPEWLASAYSGLHDLDMNLAVEKVAAGMI